MKSKKIRVGLWAIAALIASHCAVLKAGETRRTVWLVDDAHLTAKDLRGAFDRINAKGNEAESLTSPFRAVKRVVVNMRLPAITLEGHGFHRASKKINNLVILDLKAAGSKAKPQSMWISIGDMGKNHMNEVEGTVVPVFSKRGQLMNAKLVKASASFTAKGGLALIFRRHFQAALKHAAGKARFSSVY